MLPLFAIYLLWLLWLAAWFLATIAPLRGVHKLKLYEEVVYRIVTLGAGTLLLTITPWPGIDVQYRLWHRAVEDGLAWQLVATVGVSVIIACWALLHRHIAFSRGASIVTGGPYALLRHPIYLSLIIALFATALVFGRPSSFVGAGLFTLAFVTKVLIEEARTQGPAFAAYKRRTLMFVPALGFVWLFLTWVAGRLGHLVSRGAPVMPAPLPAPLPVRREPAVRWPQAPPERNHVDVPSLTRVRSVALDLVLADEETSPVG